MDAAFNRSRQGNGVNEHWVESFNFLNQLMKVSAFQPRQQLLEVEPSGLKEYYTAMG